MSYLAVVRDRRSGGCEVAAGSGCLLPIVAGWELGFGPSLRGEESDAGALESKPKGNKLQYMHNYMKPVKLWSYFVITC